MNFIEYSKPQYTLHSTNIFTDEKGHLIQTLEYDEANKWGYSKWFLPEEVRNEIGYDIVIAGCERLILFVYEHKFDRYLNDMRYVSGGWDVINPYLANEWAPRIIAAGYRYHATINSPEIYAQLSSELMEENVSEVGLVMRNFSNPEDAVAWLNSCPRLT